MNHPQKETGGVHMPKNRLKLEKILMGINGLLLKYQMEVKDG